MKIIKKSPVKKFEPIVMELTIETEVEREQLIDAIEDCINEDVLNKDLSIRFFNAIKNNLK